MSFYVEIKNWNKLGPKTFLVLSFNAASRKRGGIFSGNEADPNATYVEFQNESGRSDNYTPAIGAVIPLPYDEFRRQLLDAREHGRIPSFNKTG